MILQVVNVAGQTLTLDIATQASVLDLKRLVQYAERVELDEIGLEFAGNVLENDRTIADYDMRDGSRLHLVSALLFVIVFKRKI